MSRIFVNLDKISFGNVQVWDFISRSPNRRYAWLFFFKAVLAHPIKAFRGGQGYRRLIKQRPNIQQEYHRLLAIPDEPEFLGILVQRRVRPLVGLGFCLKPYHPADAAASCPSGRANHDCLYFEQREVRPVCSECAIYKIGSRCLDKGCPVYIMTSAKDIAEDFFLPQIDLNRYPTAILLLCPYSIQAIILPLLICRIDVFLLAYRSGSCADYRAWLKADRGIKNEMTELDENGWNKLLKLLRSLPDAECRLFRREGNIYNPH